MRLQAIGLLMCVFLLSACGGSDSGGGEVDTDIPVVPADPVDAEIVVIANEDDPRLYTFVANATAEQVATWQFAWRILDASGGSSETIVSDQFEYEFTSDGVYTVELTVTDVNDVSQTDTVEVVIGEDNQGENNRAPVASFVVTGQGLTQTFDASGSSDPDNDDLTYEWSIGTIMTLFGERVTHPFDDEGTYTITLTVSDGLLTNTVSRNIEVSGSTPTNNPPSPRFTTSLNGLSVSVDASDSFDNDGAVVAYAWDFNGEATKFGQTSSHVFSTAGSKSITLTIEDAEGAAESLTKTVFLSEGEVENRAPTAEFSYTAEDLRVNFFDISSDADGDDLSHSWSFGDGNTSTQATPSHNYAQAGDYVVELVVSDGELQSAPFTQNISVSEGNESPTASFSFSVDDLTVSFDGTASLDPDGTELSSYSWDFGDGSSSDESRPTHTYAAADTYTVRLTVSDGSLTNTASSNVTVTAEEPADEPPVASFEVTSQEDLSVAVDASDSSDAEDASGDLTYSWNFNDEATLSGRTASHTFASEGEKSIQLTVTDSAGNTDVITRTVDVSEPNEDLLTFVVENIVSGQINCSACHSSGSIAASTNLLFDDISNQAVRDALVGFIEIDNPAYAQRLKDKPAGVISHFAGNLFESFPNERIQWEAYIDQLVSELSAPSAPIDPQAAFSSSVAGFVVSLDASATVEASADEHTYTWSVDNGLTASGQVTQIDLGAAGTFEITLTVTDTASNTSDSVSRQVRTVEDAPSVAGCEGNNLSACFDFENGLPDEFAGQSSNSRSLDTTTGYNSSSSVRFETTDFADAQFFNIDVPAQDFWARVFIKSSGDLGQFANTWGGDRQGFTRPHGTLIRGRDGNAQMRIGDHRCQLEINRDQGAGHLGDDLEMTSGSYGDNDTVCEEEFGARMEPETWYCLEVHFNGPNSEIQVFWDDQNVQQLHVTEERTWTNADKPPGGQFSQNADQPWGPYAFDTFEFGYENYQGSGPAQPDGQQRKPTVTYWYDNVAVHTERIGCGDDYEINSILDESTELGPDDNGFPYTDDQVGQTPVEPPSPVPTTAPEIDEGTIIFAEDFESYNVGDYPSAWGHFVDYQTSVSEDRLDSTINVIDSDVNSGSRALHLYNDSDARPVQITRQLDPALFSDRVFLRMYIKQSVDLGRSPGNNHATLVGLRGESGGNGPEVRFGDAKGVLGINIMPTDGIAPVYEEQASQLSAAELAAAPLISKDEWHCLELAFLDDGAESQVFAWNNGELVFSLESVADFAPGGPTDPHWLEEQMNEVMIGWQSWIQGGADGVNENIYVDDIIAATGRIGCL